jgi:CheY-like chemotaxis protein
MKLAQELRPQAILLDVMLPGMDGWETLARLRRHPATERLPVIICTILPEEQLALALGASAFLRKPLAREELLQALHGVGAQSPAAG